jgi:hypothetical protein
MKVAHWEGTDEGLVVREWDSLRIEADTDETKVAVTLFERDGYLHLNIETEPDTDGHGLYVVMDGVRMDFEVMDT